MNHFFNLPRCWTFLSVLWAMTVLSWSATAAFADAVGVWEKVEITLHSAKTYENPYTDVTVWVDLKGLGFERRCYGFWDGGDTFRVRVLATAPGTWSWESGSRPADSGLTGVRGTFSAVAWTEAQRRANSSRRGMIRSTANGHAFEYADGTPFFLMGDTWWAVPTFRYRWYEDDRPRPLGPEAGFKDFVRLRSAQEYNCIAMIAAFPNWANDDKPANWAMPDGTIVRAAWKQAGTNSAKRMTNDVGQTAFLFPGRVPGYEKYIPDLERINPKYFHMMDKKIDYLNAQGMVPFIEVARRDIGQVWKKFYPWPDSYAWYIQYVWSRYQANICLFSPVHFDTPSKSIAPNDWNAAASQVIDDYGRPPFGTLTGTNANPSSLRNWGHVDEAKWLQFHQIGNRRTHDCYAFLAEIFEAAPPVPGINGEPYYDGMEDAKPGSALAALYCRSAMYGSVLSGGLGGHIYGAGGWQGGVWSGEVEAASKYPIWEVIQWPSAGHMRHLKAFILSEGRRYQDLIPAVDLLAPNRSSKPKTNVGWAYCARAPECDLFLLYFERDCRQAVLSGVSPKGRYKAQWFDPRTGDWFEADPGALAADFAGRISLPRFPNGGTKSTDDWAMKLTLVDSS